MNIGISSPFNPFELKDALYNDDQERVHNNHAATTSVHALVKGFIKLGHHVYVFSTDPTIKRAVEYHGELIDIYIIPRRLTPVKIKGTHLMTRLYLGKRLAKTIHQHINKLDVLHAQWTYDFAEACIPFTDQLPVFCTVRDWCPYILTLANGVREKIYWHISLYVFNKVISCKKIRFVANSFYTKSLIDREIKVDVPVLFNPIMEDFIIAAREQYPSVPIFISIAQSLSEKRKNINKLIIAFKKFQESIPDSQLWLVGDYNEEILNLVNDDIRDKVKFLGRVDHSDLTKVLDQCSVLVHPSLEETFGNIVLEAMARRVPVIGGDKSGAIPMLLGDGKYGCLCDVSSADSICEAMLKLTVDKSYRNEIIEKSTAFLVDNFVDYKVAEKHIDMYSKYLK